MRVIVGQFVVGEAGDLSSIPVTPEIAEAIRRVGHDPSEYNAMRWPMGASRHGSCKMLLHSDDVTTLIAAEVFSVVMGEIEFTEMTASTPIPILISEGGGTLYCVEAVDERHSWDRPLGLSAVDGSVMGSGYNVSLDDKEKLYRSSLNPDNEEPWTPFTLLSFLLASYPTDIPNTPDTTDPDDVRDVTFFGQSRGQLIDQTCRACGHVFLAYPDSAYQGVSNRYRVVPIESGEGSALIELETFADELVGGGLASRSSEGTPPISDIVKSAIGSPDWMADDVPVKIRVQFPVSATGGSGYAFNQEDDIGGVGQVLDYATERFVAYSSFSGRPIDSASSSQISVFDSKWAIVSSGIPLVIENESELMARADVVAFRYYARYFAGTGDVTFRGFTPIKPWSGVSEIVWDGMPKDAQPWTRVTGTFDDTRFGFGLTALGGQIRSTGLVRAFPRSDGGLLLDAVIPTAGLHYGRITAVQPAGTAWTYDAEGYYSSVSVQTAVPVSRAHDVTNLQVPLDLNPASIDDPCILGVRPDGTVDLWIVETALLAACAPAQAVAARSNDAMARLRAMASSRGN